MKKPGGELEARRCQVASAMSQDEPRVHPGQQVGESWYRGDSGDDATPAPRRGQAKRQMEPWLPAPTWPLRLRVARWPPCCPAMSAAADLPARLGRDVVVHKSHPILLHRLN